MNKKRFWTSKHSVALVILILLAFGYGQYRKQFMDELILDTHRITNINSSTLNNADTSIPTSQTVFNAILAASFDPASGLTGWLDITDPSFGGTPDGGFNGGTDNTPAVNAALAAAVNGSVIYIPPGSYRFYETLRWPSNKNVYLVSYGDLYFGNDTALIVDGVYRKIWLNGSLNSTDHHGTNPTYVGQTNPGIWLRNASNCEIWTNTIHGFKYALKVGGSSGGNQYNKIGWQRLRVNSVGIEVYTDGSASWSNENSYYGGQISADTGIVYNAKGGGFDNNKFYNVGLEYRGGSPQQPMRVGIYGGKVQTSAHFSMRIEPEGVTTKFMLDGTVNGFMFFGGYFYDSWLTGVGHGAMFYAPIYSSGGVMIGNEAIGYQYSPTNTYQNGRFRVKGLRWSFSAAADMASNIDIQWELDNDAITTSATYTVANGIDVVKVQYASGTNVTTLPDAQARANRTVTIKNLHASNSVTISGAASGSITSIPGYGSIVYYSDGNVWYDVANNFNTSGGGGSSQWSDDGSNIRYANRVAIARTGPTASMHIGYRNTPGTANSGGFKLDGGQVLNAPENGLLENDLVDWWITTQGTRKKILTTANIGTVTIVMGNMAEVDDANYTVVDNINCVIYNTATGTKVLTIPAAASYVGREISIKNEGASAISIPLGYYTTNSTMVTTLAAGAGVRIKSSGTKWRTIP